VGTFEV